MGRLLTAVLLISVAALSLGGVASADSTQGSTVTVGVGAHTSFDRTWNWTVSKTDDHHSSITIAQGEIFDLTYTVTVSNGSPPYTDSNWQVQDGMTLSSTAPFTLDGLGSLSAVATQDGGTVTTTGDFSVCSLDPLYDPPVTFPFTGQSLLCHYAISLPDGTPGTVTTTATFSDGSQASGSTAFDFTPGGNLMAGQPTVFDGAVDVVDSQAGPLGSLTAPVNPLHPSTFQYSIPVPSARCGSFDIPNTVSVTDHATGATVAQASDTVHVTVTCPHVNGCTLTQGYWKTHSVYGPAAKPDPAWNLLLPTGPDSPFYLSGQSWLEVFDTSPSGGNAYYVLAHQYEAAVLNQLNGASSTSAVDAAIADAESFFGAYTPAQADALAKKSKVRKQALADATTLDDYNSGLTGPGHCDE